jgi:hypothetical protein
MCMVDVSLCLKDCVASICANVGHT